jgi:hypothetical protein
MLKISSYVRVRISSFLHFGTFSLKKTASETTLELDCERIRFGTIPNYQKNEINFHSSDTITENCNCFRNEFTTSKIYIQTLLLDEILRIAEELIFLYGF